jgi:hypothetical protein
LVSKGGDILGENEDLVDPLEYAIDGQFFGQGVEALVRAGANVHTRVLEEPIINYALRTAPVFPGEFVLAMVTRGADPCSVDGLTGNTVLHLVVQDPGATLDVVSFLVDSGATASLFVTNLDGMMPSDCAENEDILEYLMDQMLIAATRVAVIE